MSLNYEPSSEPLHISAEQLFLNGGVIRKWIQAKLCSCQFKHFDGHVHAGGPSPPLARLVKQIQTIETDEFLLFWGLVARQALWRTLPPVSAVTPPCTTYAGRRLVGSLFGGVRSDLE